MKNVKDNYQQLNKIYKMLKKQEIYSNYKLHKSQH